MDWLRLYTDILDDEKIAQLSDNQYRIFTFLMLMASENDSGGIVTQSQQQIAWRLRMSVNRIKSAIDKLHQLNIISFENNIITFINWHKRQYKSDNSTDRVKRFRNKKETLPPTLENRTETDTETETEGKSFYSHEFETFWKSYPKKSGSKKAAFDSWKKLNGSKPPIELIIASIKSQKLWRENAPQGEFRPDWKDPERWIKNRMWEAEFAEDQSRASPLPMFVDCPSCGARVSRQSELVDDGCVNCKYGKPNEV